MAQKENGSAQVDGRAEHTALYGEKGIDDQPEKGGKQSLALAAAHLFQGQGLHLGIGVQLGGLGVVGGKDIEISPAGDILPSGQAAQFFRLFIGAVLIGKQAGGLRGGLQTVTALFSLSPAEGGKSKEKAVLFQKQPFFRQIGKPAFGASMS